MKRILKRILKHFKALMNYFRQHPMEQLCSELDVPVVCNKQFLINNFKDAIGQGAAKSTTKWYLNKLQCEFLRAALTWSMAQVEEVHVINASLCLELCRLVGRARNLLDSCFQWGDDLPKVILLSHTCEAFWPLILLLVRSIILIQAKNHEWSEDVIDKRAQEEYEVDCQPRLIKVAHEDHEDQMKWLTETQEHLQVQSTCNAPAVSSSGRIVKSLRERSEDSSILYINMEDIDLSALSSIGGGASGSVFKVKWLGEWCAYKEFEGAENASFKTEAAVFSTLRHPHIVHFIGFVIDQDRCALLMELLDCDLKIFLRCAKESDLVMALDIMFQIAQGMRYLHDKGIVHRDLKSANVLVNCLGGRKHAITGGYVVKVTDFGLAKTKFKSMETLRTHNVGTFQWTAPELFKTVSDEGGSTVEPTKYVFPKKADVYSFGILCSEILTGKLPFSESYGQRKILKEEILKGRRPILPDTCPRFLASFIQTCWHKSPDRRPEFDDVCTILERFKLLVLAGTSNLSPVQERGIAQSSSLAKSHPPLDNELQPEALHISISKFTMKELKYATKDFSETCKIGQGGFGTVYRGELWDGTTVAVKRAIKDTCSSMISHEIHGEIRSMLQVEHMNLVRLIGYSENPDEAILVTEYVSNGNLRQHLDGVVYNTKLDIALRLNIAIDISQALAYLHHYNDVAIIHRDVKSTNILLTDSFRAKVADFGLSRAGPIGDSETHVSTTVIYGTMGYLDPEYAITNQLNVKSDVYSFGILLLELLTGRKPIELKRPSEERVTARWAHKLFTEGNSRLIIDPKIELTPGFVAIMDRFLKLAFECCAVSKRDRPNMIKAAEVLWEIRIDYHVAENQAVPIFEKLRSKLEEQRFSGPGR